MAAGFRPCKRCKPDNLAAETESNVAIARFIEANADEKLTLATLSARAGMSPARFQKSFKAAFGVSPKQYQDAVRLERYKGALREGDDVTGAIFAAGFGSTSRVYGEVSRSVGMTPAAYRDGGKGERIDFAYRDSALGPLLMAATDRGVCFAQFGDSREQLEKQLREEFPQRSLGLIVGMDAFLGLPGWHRWEEMLSQAHIVVAHRPGWKAPDIGALGELIAERGTHRIEDLHEQTHGRVHIHAVTQLEIASTEIRDLVAAGRDPRFLMPDAVRDEILESGLYQGE